MLFHTVGVKALSKEKVTVLYFDIGRFLCLRDYRPDVDALGFIMLARIFLYSDIVWV